MSEEAELKSCRSCLYSVINVHVTSPVRVARYGTAGMKYGC